MTANRVLGLALLAGGAWGGVEAVRGQERDTASRNETARLRPTAARLAVWTDRPGYLYWHGRVRAYVAMDPGTDRGRYQQFLYLEQAATRQRRYFVRDGDGTGWSVANGVADVGGRPPAGPGERIAAAPATRIWSGRAPEPGRWQFVAELRSPDTTEIVKRAHAKFVVSQWVPVVLGAGGRETGIAEDTTWTSDRIWSVRGPVFVQPGATLSIEPGTVVLGRGAQARIVVARGGRIVARGRRDAPVVMSCDAPVGERFAGCWGGLTVLGRAPMSRGTGLAAGVAPEAWAAYGGSDAGDASGVLEHVRVEFAGAAVGAVRPAGIGLYGVGSGTRIDHVQVHASAGDGILFSGGTASCAHCVSSAAGGDALAWELGWRGTAQHVFLQQDPAAGGCGIDGANDELAFDALPRSAPALYNLTMTASTRAGRAGASGGCGIRLRSGSAITARNVIVQGPASGAIELRDNARSLFLDGTSSISGVILHAGTGRGGSAPEHASLEGLVGHLQVDPLLVTAGHRPNPDPRPRLNSPALQMGAAAVPPSDGLLDTSAQYIGAFGDSNWLEEWTFFGPESDYRAPEAEDGG